MENSLGFRLLAGLTDLSPEQVDEIIDYETDVPLFASGEEAAAHGLREIIRPGEQARRTIERLATKQGSTRRRAAR